MILYLSIVFIVAGLILVIYALLSRLRKPVSSSSDVIDKTITSSSHLDVHKTQRADEVSSRGTHQENDVITVPNLFIQGKDKKGENENKESISKETVDASETRENNIEALLYEDSSGNIDYDGLGGSIDSTLKSYDDLRLIGEGFLKLEKNGLSFVSKGRFFRFDFYKIQNFHNGDSYVALQTSVDSPIRLFLMENSAAFISNLMNEYREFKRQ
jgi:hypothetical protein